jgi:hypothetical protein
MITVAGSEPGPGGIGPGAGIRAGCADGGGGGQGERRMGLGHGGPDARSGPGRRPARAAGAPPRQVPRRDGNALLRS